MGKRPTLGGTKTLLEVFIFDFNQEIYGDSVKVVFKQKCRDEIKFGSFEELKEANTKRRGKEQSFIFRAQIKLVCQKLSMRDRFCLQKKEQRSELASLYLSGTIQETFSQALLYSMYSLLRP